MNDKIRGYVMAGVGLTILMASALGYFLHWDISGPGLTIFGLISTIVGLKLARRT
jgi:hypothetical protein